MPALAESPSATDYKLLLRLASQKINAETGVMTEVTVAKAGVRAEGKFLWLDKDGKRTNDEELAVKKLPVFTDAKTLTTLLAASTAVGPRTKTREDHDDALESRIGFAYNFKAGSGEFSDLVSADIHVFQAYRNRALLFETALHTPDQIGISIDFIPDFEIAGDRALMRVKKLEAVDIVDAGAITPDGLLLNAESVDTPEKTTAEKAASKSQPSEHMAAPTLDEVMSALSKLSDTVGQCVAGLTALKAAAPAVAGDSDALKAIKEEQVALAKTLKEESEKLSAATKANTDALANLRKERALLGLRATDAERVQLSGKGAEEIEQLAASKKSYLDLVTDRAATDKCSRAEAHGRVQRTDEGKVAYAKHLGTRGVYIPEKDATRMQAA